MRFFFTLLACLPLPLLAQEARVPVEPLEKATPADSFSKPELSPNDLVTQRSLARLEQKLGVKFNHPFPVAEFDLDEYLRQPIALLPVAEGKVAVTRPIINPHDGAGSIEWMIGTEKIRTLGEISLSAFVYLDERGEFIQISLLAAPDYWSTQTGTSQLIRNEGETGWEFVERALLTYRLRSKKAGDQKQALLLLSGFEKTLAAIHQCRWDEVLKKP
jgi:hypothetical protein